MGPGGDARLCQPGGQTGGVHLQGVHLNHGFGCLVIGNQHGFQLPLGQVGFQKGNQFLRVAVAVSVGDRLFQLPLGIRRPTEHSVDQSRRFGVFAVPLGQGNRLVHRGRIGNSVQLINLVQSQMKNVPHRRVQILQPSGEQLSKIIVQLAPVLNHAIAQPGGQRRIPAVQPIPMNIGFQHPIGPGAFLPAGNQRIQRRLPGAHQPFRGCPRK